MTTEPGGAPSQPLEIGLVSTEAKPVDHYLQAVGDQLPIYRESGLAPPLYGSAAALGLLLKALELPPGAIHSLQELDTLAPIAVNQQLKATATLERPRQRGGLNFITASCQLQAGDRPPAIAGKTTVLVPGGTDASGERESSPRERTAVASRSELAYVRRDITRERLAAYSAASGDDSPLHLDDDFAAGTRFGGIIAHGMLTLAFISEMMAAALGERWLTSGSLRVRFKGAAYLGDSVETWGQRKGTSGERENFAVGVRNQTTGEDLITGTATVK